MRIGGVEISGPNEEILVLPRLENDIVIRARAVSNMDPFEKLVPEPKAPGKLTKEGWVPNTKDETYRQRVATYQSQRINYMVICSLEPSEIEWETVDLDNPKTWSNWSDELKSAGFSDVEVNRVLMCTMQANALDEGKLKEAREVFLRGVAEAQKESSGHQTEQEISPSGEPVNGSE